MSYAIFGILVFAGTLCFVLGVYSLSVKSKPNSKIFSLLMFSFFIYILGYSFEIVSKSTEAIILSMKVEYIGIGAIPFLWILLPFEFWDKGKKYKKRVMIILGLWGMLGLMSVLTNDFHGLYYSNTGYIRLHGLTITDTTKGPLYFVNMAYIHLSGIFGVYLYYKSFKDLSIYIRKQYGLIFFGSFIPWITSGVSRVWDIHLFGLEMTPFIILIIVIIYIRAIFSNGYFNFSTFARSRVIDDMGDMILVLDNRNLIIDYNASFKAGFQSKNGDVENDITIIFNQYEGIIEKLEKDLYGSFEIQNKFDKEKHLSFKISPMKANTDEVLGKILVMYDISEKVNHLRKLDKNASYDFLTGSYNRGKFFEIVSKNLSNLKWGNNATFAIMDIDNFKNINDTYGHEVGDMVLKEFSRIVGETLPREVVSGRYGGEEFVVFIENRDEFAVLFMMEKVRREIEEFTMDIYGQTISFTVSIGIATDKYHKDYEVNEILRRADMALYRVKKSGKNRVEVFWNDVGI